MHVLGIDAGGTKTVALLADADGHVLAEGRAGAANLHTEGELEVEKILHTVIDLATDGRDVTLSAVCLGIAGVDREDDARIIRGIMRRMGYRSNTLIVNDAMIALVAGAGASPGVVVIAGTGSIAYGVSHHGVAARAGGWGRRSVMKARDTGWSAGPRGGDARRRWPRPTHRAHADGAAAFLVAESTGPGRGNLSPAARAPRDCFACGGRRSARGRRPTR